MSDDNKRMTAKRRPPQEHNKILAIIYMLHGSVHAGALIFLLAFLFFFKGRLSNFSDTNLILLAALSLAVLSSLNAGWAALNLRWGSARALGVAAVVALILAGSVLFFVLFTAHLTARRVLVTSIYWLPSITIGVYSLWYLRRNQT